MGNYKGFGDCKFVPNLLEDRMEKLVLASQAAANNPEGVTKYFTSNCDAKDSDVINAYLKHKNIEGMIRIILVE